MGLGIPLINACPVNHCTGRAEHPHGSQQVNRGGFDNGNRCNRVTIFCKPPAQPFDAIRTAASLIVNSDKNVHAFVSTDLYISSFQDEITGIGHGDRATQHTEIRILIYPFGDHIPKREPFLIPVGLPELAFYNVPADHPNGIRRKHPDVPHLQFILIP